VNFLMEKGDERVAGSYSGNLERLAAIKAKYDLGNPVSRASEHQAGGVASCGDATGVSNSS